MSDQTRHDEELSSEISGFYKLDRPTRLKIIAERLGINPVKLEEILNSGGLSASEADILSENVLGVFALPFSVATNFRINGRDILVPMVTEEPSVVAAASHGAKMTRQGAGIIARCTKPIMIGQVHLLVPDPEDAQKNIERAKTEILEVAKKACPTVVSLGGGPQDIETRVLEDEKDAFLVVHILVDVQDAMGANIVNSVAEAVAPLLEKITGGKALMRILTNLADKRLVRATASVPFSALSSDRVSGEEVANLIAKASRMAELDPHRACTHNKGIMNGVDAVLVATGNDFRAVEAGAHAYACMSGRYLPLCKWKVTGDQLSGEIEMPMAVGVVGGATRSHPLARLSIALLGAKTAFDIAQSAVAVGMCCNLSALRALVTEGIQKGHMNLHKRRKVLEV
jgi:hydroxymethylglutaryl-CoA reductase